MLQEKTKGKLSELGTTGDLLHEVVAWPILANDTLSKKLLVVKPFAELNESKIIICGIDRSVITKKTAIRLHCRLKKFSMAGP